MRRSWHNCTPSKGGVFFKFKYTHILQEVSYSRPTKSFIVVIW